MKYVLLVLMAILPFREDEEGWKLFAGVRFTPKYFPEYKEKFLVPNFESSILSKVGTEITVRGHYLPFDLQGNSIIISKFPYAACFFCGGAGPESVAEIFFSTKPPKFKPDQVITVRGKLRLNDTDVNHMNFILDDAELL
ncbi:MAG: DUF3299 domain-containing protein [Cyclobacteriaceae bacterium]|nr:DUF3299 domain-containing protein [Cyclobacteriaceae bacterium]